MDTLGSWSNSLGSLSDALHCTHTQKVGDPKSQPGLCPAGQGEGSGCHKQRGKSLSLQRLQPLHSHPLLPTLAGKN